MKAIIMAGGEGTRLRPLTCTEPKPMAKVMNKPIMEHILELLKKHGFYDIGVTLQYMPDSIRDYFGDGNAYGVNLTYFVEETPLGTAGSVSSAGDFLDGDFLVISGDALCDFDLKAAIDFHHQKGAEATLVLAPMEVPLEYGVVVTAPDGKIERFVEKPIWSQVFSDTVNTGIYILNPSVFDGIDMCPLDFSKDVFPKMLAENRGIYGFVAEGYWCDIGDLDVYRHCHFDIFDKKVDFRLDAREIANGVFAGEDTLIEEGAIVNAPALLGRGVRIREGAVVDGYTVIGDNCTVNPHASIKRSIIRSGVVIGQKAQIRGSVICDRSVIRRSASIFEQSIIGEASVVGENAVIKPGIKIWPYKSVGQGEIVSSNLIWGVSHSRNLFGERGIEGQVNVDLPPEFLSRIGGAFGSMKTNEKIGISADGSPASVMLKNALCSGLLSSGTEVFDFGEQPLPITRSGVKFYGLHGGVHAAVYESEGEGKGSIDIINGFGANIGRDDERKLQNVFQREDFVRPGPEGIRAICDLYEYKLYYLREIINSTHTKDMGLKILAASSSDWGQRLLSSAAADLKCDIRVLKQAPDIKNKNALQEFAKEVTGSGYSFGAITDRGCEKILLADERGRILNEDVYKVLVALMIMKQYPGATIAASVSAPAVIDTLAEKYGAAVQRTKESPIELMGALCGNSTTAEMRDQFVLHFDAVGAVIKIIDFLKKYSTTISQLTEEIPEFHIVKKEIDCSFGDKGRVIRRIIETGDSGKMKTLDGVKIDEEKGYVLIIPDISRPVCRVIVEAENEEYASELTEIYSDKIKKIIDPS